MTYLSFTLCTYYFPFEDKKNYTLGPPFEDRGSIFYDTHCTSIEDSQISVKNAMASEGSLSLLNLVC